MLKTGEKAEIVLKIGEKEQIEQKRLKFFRLLISLSQTGSQVTGKKGEKAENSVEKMCTF